MMGDIVNSPTPDLEKIQVMEEKPPSGDVVHKKIGGTTYEVVSNYVGKNSLLDIVKSAIKRDIENGNY